MATTLGQITSEFITRAEKHVMDEFLEICQKREDGREYETQLWKLGDLFSFLVELQSLSNPWTERQCRQYIDFWDDECSLKSIQGAYPDPYKVYENITPIINQTTVLSVPTGEGLLYQNAVGDIVLVADSNQIESDYGLG